MASTVCSLLAKQSPQGRIALQPGSSRSHGCGQWLTQAPACWPRSGSVRARRPRLRLTILSSHIRVTVHQLDGCQVDCISDIQLPVSLRVWAGRRRCRAEAQHASVGPGAAVPPCTPVIVKQIEEEVLVGDGCNSMVVCYSHHVVVCEPLQVNGRVGGIGRLVAKGHQGGAEEAAGRQLGGRGAGRLGCTGWRERRGCTSGIVGGGRDKQSEPQMRERQVVMTAGKPHMHAANVHAGCQGSRARGGAFRWQLPA